MLIIQSGCGVPDMVFLDHLKLGHKTSQRIKVRFGYLHNCFDSEEENFFFFSFLRRAWNSKITDRKFLLMKSEIVIVPLVCL